MSWSEKRHNGSRSSPGYAVPTAGCTASADYEVLLLEEQPRLNLHWVVAATLHEPLDLETATTFAAYGAAGRSAAARTRQLTSALGAVRLQDTPLAVVGPATLAEQAGVTTGPRASEALAGQLAARTGGLVVEAWEAR